MSTPNIKYQIRKYSEKVLLINYYKQRSVFDPLIAFLFSFS